MTADPQLDWLHVLIDVPARLAAPTRQFWSRVLGWPTGEPWPRHPEFTTLVPPSGDGYVHVQQVGAAPRVHVDVVADDLDRERDRLVDLGAGVGDRTDSWQVMRSPGGLPFCLCRGPRPGAVPRPVEWPGGHVSRLAQICVDIPAELHEPESAFWQQLTGWDRKRSRFPELELLVGRASPVQLLLQRLGPDDPGTSVRAHIDLGTDDVAAETERVLALGAQLLDADHPWTVLTDPAGLPFCVTAKRPR